MAKVMEVMKVFHLFFPVFFSIFDLTTDILYVLEDDFTHYEFKLLSIIFLFVTPFINFMNWLVFLVLNKMKKQTFAKDKEQIENCD